ncbi:MAG: transposase [Candidatus Saccharimonadales bacterium]
MPIRNTIKQYDAPAYYHVYNRGALDSQIFLDDADRNKFLSLFARHLDPANDDTKTDGKVYEKYDVELVAYCLMGNHFHLLLFQETDPTMITQLMRSVATAYTMYFNHKYKRHGHLFQSVFKASHITDESYLLHITRYIHMNPRNYMRYQWSSISYYLGAKQPDWLRTDKINDMPPTAYKQFLRDYEGKREESELLKAMLVDSQ